MPRMPKWMANASEKLFSKHIHPVEVTEAEYLDADLKRIRFQGDLSNTEFVAGDVIEFRVNETDFRHYTPSLYDSEEGVCEVLFYLHGQGPGSEWVQDLKSDDLVKLLGPGGKLRYNPEFEHHVLFGDESSLGWMKCMQEAILQEKQHHSSFLELDSDHDHWPKLLSINAVKAGKAARELSNSFISLFESECESILKNATNTLFYLTGRASSIQALRRFLRSKEVDKKQIKVEPYWSEGKRGL